jgi:exopolysaccharide biosynthesis polyprenyl glycosylphosphotransferase
LTNPASNETIRARVETAESAAKEAHASGTETRRYRISSPRLAIPLPAYDIRVRRELAHRRTFLAIGRHVLRVVSLHILDGIGVATAAFVALEMTATPVGPSIIPLMVGLTLLGLLGRGAYQAAHHRRDPWRIVSGIMLAVLAAVMISVLAPLSVLPPEYNLPAEFVAAFAILATIAVLGERAIVDAIVRQAYAHGVGLRRAVVVGRAGDVESVMQGLRQDQHIDHFIVGHVVPGPTHDPGALGTLVDLESVVRREEPAELILCTQLSAEAYRRVADICVRNGVSILAIPSWTKSNRGWAEPVVIGQMPAFWLHPVRLEMPSLVLKRSADIAFTAVGLVICLPIIALIGIAIKLDSRGPVFFKQRRVGLGGREFTMWKFRSMHHLSERRHEEVAHLNHYADARLFKAQNDPRITRVGRWLRRFSLDELPQLFNVIAGDMSLVGPRPPLPHEVKKYEARHFVRLTVVPGMTGPWQVGGRNLITDFEEVVRLEQEYVERWSFRLDLRIMFKTLGVMLSGKGAY